MTKPCPYCGSLACEWDGDRLLGCEDCGYDAPEPGTYACEDYPCCGHEWGDCDGSKYGSDESIKQKVYERIANGEDDWPDEHEE